MEKNLGSNLSLSKALTLTAYSFVSLLVVPRTKIIAASKIDVSKLTTTRVKQTGRLIVKAQEEF